MKFSDYVKLSLLDAIRDLTAHPDNFARCPGRDFSCNRKIPIQDLLMLLTMEADCVKEELYRYFGRFSTAPSKAAFYKQRKNFGMTLSVPFSSLLIKSVKSISLKESTL